MYQTGLYMWRFAGGEALEMDVYEVWTDKAGRRFEMRAVKPEDKQLMEAAFKVCL